MSDESWEMEKKKRESDKTSNRLLKRTVCVCVNLCNAHRLIELTQCYKPPL